MSVSARIHSVTSSDSSSNLPLGANGSRKYRRIAHKPQVDDTLFGERNQLLKNRKNDRTRQAGRVIAGTNSSTLSNQESESKDKPSLACHPNAKQGERKGINKSPITVVLVNELERIRAETKILTAAELETLEAKREADQEHQRLTSKARKEHMLKLSEEAAQRVPKSEIAQIFSAEKEEIRRRARVLKDHMHDGVKLMKTLGTRAQAFTIRDQQLQVKKDLEEEHCVYDEKMNTLMEIGRLESLKRQEQRDETKKQKRYADRKVLEDQIETRRQQRQKEKNLIAQEAQEMLSKIQRQQEEETMKEKAKAKSAQQLMDQIKQFNEDALMKKEETLRKMKEEDDQVLAYQIRKAEDLKRQEEEEALRRHEAELRCAKLRSMQEKVANEKAELDDLRARRAAEARERQAREADLSLARKHKEQMDELQRSRNAQAMHRERARVKEATMQQFEYESIMKQVESDKARVKIEEEKRRLASLTHRSLLQSQIEEKERLKKLAFVKKQEEGQTLKDEFARELEKLEKIRLEEVDGLIGAGVNPLYLSEMKALVIEKHIRSFQPSNKGTGQNEGTWRRRRTCNATVRVGGSRVRPTLWHPMSMVELAMMDTSVLPQLSSSMRTVPIASSDEEFFKDLPMNEEQKEKKDETPETENERAFSSYSFSSSSVLDENGQKVMSTRRRYEDSTGRLKAEHEREVLGKRLKTVWNRKNAKDEGEHHTICSQGTPEEFEKIWSTTAFGKAQDKKSKELKESGEPAETSQQQSQQDSSMLGGKSAAW